MQTYLAFYTQLIDVDTKLKKDKCYLECKVSYRITINIPIYHQYTNIPSIYQYTINLILHIIKRDI